MTRRLLAAAAAAIGLLAFSAAAGAATLGVTAPPTGASTKTCGASELVGQQTDDPSTPYIIPTGGGTITQWQTYTVGDTAGASITLVVLHHTGGSDLTVTAIDTETLPSPLPANNVASFTPATPLTVAAGDSLALYSNTSDACYFFNPTVGSTTTGSTPTGDSLFHLHLPTFPPTLNEQGSILDVSPSGYTLNLAATLVQQQDASVQALTFPSAIDVASSSLLRALVTNNGPAVTPITVTDQVPAGLAVQLATAELGTCSVSGQTVTCTITGLPAGQSAAVNVIVTPSHPGNFQNNVSVGVASGVTDPNAANNVASATMAAGTLPDRCLVPGLRGTRAASDRRLLRELGCRARLVHRHSRRRAGVVIRVRGGVRTYPYGTVVTLIVSSGPRRKHR